MDDLITVLIVDDNAEIVDVLYNHLNQRNGILITGIARDGIEAIDMIKRLTPDIVLLDIIMPNLDGIGVLERISMMQLKRKPIFLVLTAISNEIFIQRAMELGAEYYMLKPFAMNVLTMRIQQLYHERNNDKIKTPIWGSRSADMPETTVGDLETVVTILIRELGITPNISGYYFLREAVILAVESQYAHRSISRYVYPTIANKNNTTVRSVDRAIRGAISSASKKARCGVNSDQPSLSDTIFRMKLTNSQIISLLADKAKQQINQLS